jgi:hypothetical protein
MSNATVTTDHDEIRRWAEKHGGKPAAVNRTHEDGDVGIIRIMFPKAPNSQHEALEEISWEEFFEQFEEANLALLHDENGLFNKIIGRDTAEKREHGDNKASRHQDGGGREYPAASHAGSKPRGGSEPSAESGDLKRREYKDAEGNVHHHTHTYMEQHGKK